MAKVFKVVFTKPHNTCKIPEGLELNVTTNGSKPTYNDVKKVLEDSGYKIGGANVSGNYKIV